MDIEHLNRKQILLLTLLVSFVTSIATGIVTVSLMEQAPPQVAATVNHVIERTVQQVGSPITNTISTVKTVVVKNDDLAAQSITTVRKSVIRIVDKEAPDTLVARGIVIDAKGVAITDRGSLFLSHAYEAILPDGSRVALEMRASATTTPVVIVDLKLGTTTAPLTAATFTDPSKLALGQTVLRIGGAGEDMIGEGIISALPSNVDMVQSSVTSATPGSVLTTLFGEVVGIITTDSLTKGNDFYSMPDIFKAAAQSGAASANASQAASAATGAAAAQGSGTATPSR